MGAVPAPTQSKDAAPLPATAPFDFAIASLRVPVERQLQEPHSLLNLYRSLIARRKASPALQIGSYRSLDTPPAVYAYVRQHGKQRCLVALNFSTERQEISLPDLGAGVVLVDTGLSRLDEAVDCAKLPLRPYDGLLIEMD